MILILLESKRTPKLDNLGIGSSSNNMSATPTKTRAFPGNQLRSTSGRGIPLKDKIMKPRINSASDSFDSRESSPRGIDPERIEDGMEDLDRYVSTNRLVKFNSINLYRIERN